MKNTNSLQKCFGFTNFSLLKPARFIFQEQPKTPDKPPVTEAKEQQEITGEEGPDKEAALKAKNAVDAGNKALDKVVSATGATDEFIKYEGEEKEELRVTLPLSPEVAASRAQFLAQEAARKNKRS